MSRKIAVLGAGSWGTALAVHLSGKDLPIYLWDHDLNHINMLKKDYENKKHLPKINFPKSLNIATDLKSAIIDADYFLIVVPSEACRVVLDSILTQTQSKPISVIWAGKGFDNQTTGLISSVFSEKLPATSRFGIISGPSFAKEVAEGRPAAVTIASEDQKFASELAELFSTPYFRVYTSDDVPGIQLGGGIKNILAIAAGISDGLGYGANARAALITRGLNEILQLGDKFGAKRETMFGLSGLGDLVLTCTDDQSRNRRLGLALATQKTLEEAKKDIQQVAEGAAAAQVVNDMGRKFGLDMPICSVVYKVLYEQMSPEQAVTELLEREQKPEASS